MLIGLIGKEASILKDRSAGSLPERPLQIENADLEVWEHHIESKIESDRRIPETEREALIVARRGQGLFKQRVMEIETRCRITGVTNPIHLRASHCKLWRDSNNEERLDGENGLLLTPTMDHLFDRVADVEAEDDEPTLPRAVNYTPQPDHGGWQERGNKHWP